MFVAYLFLYVRFGAEIWHFAFLLNQWKTSVSVSALFENDNNFALIKR